MSNASHLLHGVLMAPVTVLFGAAVSFALLVALNLAATAAGWYLLLARGLRLRPGRGDRRRRLRRLRAGHDLAVQQPPAHDRAVAGAADRLVRDPADPGHAPRRADRASPRRSAWPCWSCAQVLLGEEVLFLTALTAGALRARRTR